MHSSHPRFLVLLLLSPCLAARPQEGQRPPAPPPPVASPAQAPGGEGAAPGAGGETAAPEAETLDVAAVVAEVLERNAELAQLRSEVEAAVSESRAAGALEPPEITAGVGWKTVRSKGHLAGEGLAWSVAAVQTFEWPGRLALRKAIADRDLDLARLGLQRFEKAVAARARLLAARLYSAYERASSAEEVAGRFEELSEVLLARDAAGVAPRLEVHGMEASAVSLRKRATDAALEAQSALLELNLLAGRSPLRRLKVRRPTFSFRDIGRLEEVVDRALGSSFEIKARVLELERQGLKVELARNERLPAVTLGPTYSEERAAEVERIVGVTLELPLTVWGAGRSRVSAAEARRAQASAALLAARRGVEVRIVELATMYGLRTAALARWRQKPLERFRESARLADEHYRLGAVPAQTYTALQQQYLDALEAVLGSEQEALEAAYALETEAGLAPLATVEPERGAR